MAEIFDFYVADNRTIKFNPIEPILQEDNRVAVWQFRIPKMLNNIDMSGFAWWFVYINAAKQKYSEPLTLTADTDDPDNYCIADYTIDYGISLTPGSFTFALEAINANGSGDIIEEWHTKTYSHSVIGTLQGNQAEYSETESDIISALIVQIQQKYNSLVGGATPIPVASVSQMTDTSKIYLLTTDNNWYYYNGTAWVSGGQYASGIVIDPTLTQSGQAADAKVVGDEIEGVEKDISDLMAQRKPYKTGMSVYSMPTGFVNQFDVNIFTDGGIYATDFDSEKFKNNGGTTYYVDNKNHHANSYTGLTPELATTLSRAYGFATDGDTIVILEDLDRSGGDWGFTINKSINIIGIGNRKIRFYDGNFPAFSALSGYENVYYATRASGTMCVLDVSDKDDIIAFSNVSSLEEVAAKKGSFYKTENTYYVNPITTESIENTKIFIGVNYGSPFATENGTTDTNVYYENIELIGNHKGVKINGRANAETSLRVCFNRCGVKHSGYEAEAHNGVNVTGGYIVFNKCEINNNGRDGINYTGSDSYGLEIGVIACYNGVGASANTMNGSTGHNGSTIIRIDGLYYGNQGANVCDVQAGTKSLNLGCIAFSPSCTDGYSQNFSAQQSGAEMWFENCLASNAIYDVYVAADATVHLYKTAYETYRELGTLDISRQGTPFELILRKLLTNSLSC